MKYVTAVACTGLVVLVSSVVLLSMEKHRAAFETAMTDYEECMDTRTGMSPSQFYSKFGYYPECY